MFYFLCATQYTTDCPTALIRQRLVCGKLVRPNISTTHITQFLNRFGKSPFKNTTLKQVVFQPHLHGCETCDKNTPQQSSILLNCDKTYFSRVLFCQLLSPLINIEQWVWKQWWVIWYKNWSIVHKILTDFAFRFPYICKTNKIWWLYTKWYRKAMDLTNELMSSSHFYA